MSIADLRKDYSHASLSRSEVLDDPIAQFGKWFDEALRADIPEPNAMQRVKNKGLMTMVCTVTEFIWSQSYCTGSSEETCAASSVECSAKACSRWALTPVCANSAATRIAFMMARSFDEPCPTMLTPRRPSKGAPPYSE